MCKYHLFPRKRKKNEGGHSWKSKKVYNKCQSLWLDKKLANIHLDNSWKNTAFWTWPSIQVQLLWSILVLGVEYRESWVQTSVLSVTAVHCCTG